MNGSAITDVQMSAGTDEKHGQGINYAKTEGFDGTTDNSLPAWYQFGLQCKSKIVWHESALWSVETKERHLLQTQLDSGFYVGKAHQCRASTKTPILIITDGRKSSDSNK